MSRCDIQIEIDQNNRTYKAGETVSGTVRLQNDEQVTCKKLTVELVW